MAHIQLPEIPGIIALLVHFPESAEKLRELTETLLRGPSPLTAAEREIVAAYVSSLNACRFCASTHAAAARHLGHPEERTLVDAVCADPLTAPISEKLRALLTIAARVVESGRAVQRGDIEAARAAGAGDREIHDTVLIAAAFCMFNRYVDGLATWTPEDEGMYDDIGSRLAREGYLLRLESPA